MKDKARALVITALGHRILRQVAAGTYKTQKRKPYPSVAGTRMHKGKRRAKFRGKHGRRNRN